MSKVIKYVSSIKTTTGAGTFADPYASVDLALRDTAVTEAWQIRVLQGHVEPSSQPWWLGWGTVGAPSVAAIDYCEIIAASSVDGSQLTPATPANRIVMKQPSEIDHSISVCGMDFDGSANSYFNIQNVADKSVYLLENCGAAVSGNYFSTASNSDTRFILKSCDFVIRGSVLVFNSTTVLIEGGSIAQQTPGVATTLIISNIGRGVTADFEDVDCSSFAASDLTIMGSGGEMVVSMTRVALPASLALFSAASSITSTLELYGCTVGGIEKPNGIHSRYASFEVSSATYITAGSGNSFAYTPAAPGHPTLHPMEFAIFADVVDLTAGKAVTVEVISDGGVADDALIIEYGYTNQAGGGNRGESNANRFTRVAPPLLPASAKVTGDWTGAPVGWAAPTTQSITLAIPADAGAAASLLQVKAYVAGTNDFIVSADVVVV